MDLAQSIKNNLDLVHDTIKNLSQKFPTPLLIAVTKTHPLETIKIAYQHGVHDFGENYAKEFESKAKSLIYNDIQWHYLGKLQSNKIKIISAYAAWVHSLSETRHARLLNQHRQGTKPLQVLIEVNISSEENKGGLKELSQIIELATVIKDLPNLQLRGLMGMASHTEDKDLIAAQFKLLASYLDELKNSGFKVDHLSMGMSGDYLIAIENGATMIRVGSKIFGHRRKS